VPGLSEFRTDNKGRPLEPHAMEGPSLLTIGFVSMPMHFHPSLQPDSIFRYLGHLTFEGRDAYVVAFAQPPEAAQAGAAVEFGNRTRGILVQGIDKMDPISYQILQMHVDLLAPRPDLGVKVIVQRADPDLIGWCLGFVKKGAEATGRDPRSIEVMSAAPVWISADLELARERVRWFPALVSNHVLDLVSRYKPEELPPALTSYVRDRGRYDYLHHCEVDSDHAKFVSDEVVDRFCLVGGAEAHREKLRALAAAGVTQFNIYLMCGEEEQILETYRKEVLPAFGEGAANA